VCLGTGVVMESWREPITEMAGLVSVMELERLFRLQSSDMG
jgi:hypothetical protein